MAVSDFYPFQPNGKITLEQWNELFDAIRDGSFFLDTDPIASQINSLVTRVAVLEQEVAYLVQLKGKLYQKHQEALVDGQTQVTLAHTPVLDSESVHLNGIYLSKTRVTEDYVGDYSIDGAVVTLSQDVAIGVSAGDILSISYQYEVPGHA